MKARLILLSVVVAAIALYVAACTNSPFQAQAIARQLADARSTVAGLEAQAAAATQPLVIPATGSATQPTVIPPPPSVVKEAQKAQAQLAQVDAGLAQGQAIVNAAVQSGGNPGVLVQQGSQVLGAAVAPGNPAVGYGIVLGGTILGGLLGKWWENRQGNARMASVNKALNDAIEAKQITVQPGAAAAVNKLVADHPSTDAVVDILSAAGGGAYISR